MQLLGAHPQTLAFYSDLIGAGVLFTVVTYVCLSALQSSPTERVHACLPLSIVFAGLAIALSIRMASR